MDCWYSLAYSFSLPATVPEYLDSRYTPCYGRRMEVSMTSCCVHCQSTLPFKTHEAIPRRESCSNCGNDLHCCLQCDHYEPEAYNSCREPQAERVTDKERANFCDYFRLSSGSDEAKKEGRSAAQEARKKLDELFS
ncbi:hypothetical protein MRY87_11725 [bacterium]|nr:hypothetical protein [bacterium]